MQRVSERDVSPASPLPGKGQNKVKGQALILINKIYDQWRPWLMGLEQQGLEESWRPNILHVEGLESIIKGSTAELFFTLPAGSYATVVLRELFTNNTISSEG